VFSYLDDCCLAGKAEDVAAAFSSLQAHARAIGLEFSLDKCELIPTAGANSSADLSSFPQEMKVKLDQNFELLGGPIGSAEYCNAHTTERVEKATKLLSALGELPDPQVALKLLRHCAGFSKMVYSARVVPSVDHRPALKAFDEAVRACFEQFTCLSLDDGYWTLATLSTGKSGLGIRAIAEHCDAAFLASRTSCHELCRELDPQHTLHSAVFASPELASLNNINGRVDEDDKVPAGLPEKLRQQSLSAAIDKHVAKQLSMPGLASQARRAHLKLTSGNGSWLHATPAASGILRAEPLLYTTMIRRWLRAPFSDLDSFCPFCDGIMDRYGDHGCVCCGGGDRTRRHNIIRNASSEGAAVAGLNPELERPGLLPQRPLIGSRCEDGSTPPSDDNTHLRRPADVYIPHFDAGAPAALDFAVTSGLRDDIMSASILDADAASLRYEDLKCSYKNTRALCQEQGIRFVPMILEATGGGWGKEARKVWTRLAKAASLTTGEPESKQAVQLLQRLSFALHKENARAVMRRVAAPGAMQNEQGPAVAPTLADESL